MSNIGKVGCKKCGCSFRCTNLDNLSVGECMSCGASWPRVVSHNIPSTPRAYPPHHRRMVCRGGGKQVARLCDASGRDDRLDRETAKHKETPVGLARAT